MTAQIFVPSHNDVWVGRARRTPTGRAFFAFSRFPATRSAALPDGSHRVRAMDMRFLGPTAARAGTRPAGSRAVRA